MILLEEELFLELEMKILKRTSKKFKGRGIKNSLFFFLFLLYNSKILIYVKKTRKYDKRRTRKIRKRNSREVK